MIFKLTMLVPRTRTRFGQRSFHVAAPVVWNSLPTHLCSTSVSCEQFRDIEDPSLHTGLRLPLRTFCLRAYTTLTLTFMPLSSNSVCPHRCKNRPSNGKLLKRRVVYSGPYHTDSSGWQAKKRTPEDGVAENISAESRKSQDRVGGGWRCRNGSVKMATSCCPMYTDTWNELLSLRLLL